jgi:hypothetical protein
VSTAGWTIRHLLRGSFEPPFGYREESPTNLPSRPHVVYRSPRPAWHDQRPIPSARPAIGRRITRRSTRTRTRPRSSWSLRSLTYTRLGVASAGTTPTPPPGDSPAPVTRWWPDSVRRPGCRGRRSWSPDAVTGRGRRWRAGRRRVDASGTPGGQQGGPGQAAMNRAPPTRVGQAGPRQDRLPSRSVAQSRGSAYCQWPSWFGQRRPVELQVLHVRRSPRRLVLVCPLQYSHSNNVSKHFLHFSIGLPLGWWNSQKRARAGSGLPSTPSVLLRGNILTNRLGQAP